jgi:hypothetical protein
MRQVAEQTILQEENASSNLKLKWGGSEARNRRRLPASDDIATLLQQVSNVTLRKRAMNVTSVTRMGVWVNTHFSPFAACWTFKTFLSSGKKSKITCIACKQATPLRVPTACIFLDVDTM